MLCIALLFVVTFRFRITIHQSVLDLNENIAARELTWYFIEVFTAFIVAFYVVEWREDSLRSGELYPGPTISLPTEEKENTTYEI